MSGLTEQQERAVARRDGSLMVRAGAGTGKTTVLVERFVRAVTEDGVPVESILAITFTDKAAAEMRTRVRRRFVELGRRADARAAEGAWISTIHGFCARVLRAHALSAGIDPDFRVLGELESERIAADAFDGALGAFMESDPERLELVASYTPDGLGDMVRTAYSRLRSRGGAPPAPRPAAGPAHARPARAARGGRRRRAARARRGRRRGERDPRDRARRALRRVAGAPSGGRASRAGRVRQALVRPQRQGALHGAVRRVRGRAGRVRRALQRVQGVPRPRHAACAARALRRALRARQARAVGARLRGPRAAHARPAGRARGPAPAVRGALPARARGRVPGHQPAPERADRAAGPRQPVPRRRREPVDLRLPQRGRRGVPRPLGGGRRGRARREHHGQLPQPRRGAGGDRPLLQLDLARPLRAARGGARRARRARRGCRPAWSCS